ncbi:MAG: protein kinase domain-containing protein [Candidatus Xenobia bacterium]
MPKESITPDPMRYTSVATLKATVASSVGLVADVASHAHYVARRLPMPADRELLRDWPRPLLHPGVQLFVKTIETPRAVWTLSEFTPGWPADFVKRVMPTVEMQWVVPWLNNLLEALDFLHSQGIVLGRLHPSDVVLGVNGPVIVDLGYHEHVGAVRPDVPTPYDPPECISAPGATPQMDLYAVGSIAVLLLTGSPPDQSGSDTRKRLGGMGRFPPQLLKLLASLVHPVPAARPGSAREALDTLKAFVDPVYPRPAVPEPLLPRDEVPAPWLIRDEDQATDRIKKSRALVQTVRLTSNTETPVVGAEEPTSPDADAWTPLAVLKRGPHSVVVLLEEIKTQALRVGRWTRIPSGIDSVSARDACGTVAENMVALRHPRMAAVRNFVPDLSGSWFLSDFVPGWPADQLPARRIEPAWVVLWTLQMLETIAYLHGQGVMLGKIEPSDVVLGPTGASLVDLRLYERAFPRVAAMGSLGVLELPFQAPERRNAVREDPQSDVFSVAAIAWWLLIAKAPVMAAPSDHDMLREHMAHFRPDVPEALTACLTEMLIYNPVKRPTVQQAIDRLKQVPHAENVVNSDVELLADPVPWLPASARLEVPKPARKPAAPPKPPPPPHPAPLPPGSAPWDKVTQRTRVENTREPVPPARIATAVIVVCFLIVVGWTLHGSRPAPPPSQPLPLPVTPARLATVQMGHASTRAAGGQWASQQDLEEGMLIRSDSAQCVLALDGQDNVRLDEGSVIRGSRQGGEVGLRLMSGRMWLHAGDNNAQVSVPGGLIRVSAPSDVLFDGSQADRIVIWCARGSVEVVAGGPDPTPLATGDALGLVTGHPRKAAPPQPDAWVVWNQSLR